MKPPKWLHRLPRKLIDDAITSALLNTISGSWEEQDSNDLRFKLREAVRKRAIELLDDPEFAPKVDAFARETIREVMARLEKKP